MTKKAPPKSSPKAKSVNHINGAYLTVFGANNEVRARLIRDLVLELDNGDAVALVLTAHRAINERGATAPSLKAVN